MADVGIGLISSRSDADPHPSRTSRDHSTPRMGKEPARGNEHPPSTPHGDCDLEAPVRIEEGEALLAQVEDPDFSFVAHRVELLGFHRQGAIPVRKVHDGLSGEGSGQDPHWENHDEGQGESTKTMHESNLLRQRAGKVPN